mgnify:CR=1 FL=1
MKKFLIFNLVCTFFVVNPVIITAQKTAKDYYDIGLKKVNSENYYGAIADYSKAIELNPNYAIAFNDRGAAKKKLEDYDGAIADYSKAIELNPNYLNAYYNRGNSKFNLKDYDGAIADFTKAIELNPNFADAYANRGTSKWYLKQNYCPDYKKACELGDCTNYNKFCK